MHSAAAVLATLALGLTAGALLAEAAVLIPWWRSLPPGDFLAWYAANTSRLFYFFGPLEMACAVLLIVAAVRVRGWFIAAAALSLAVLAMFPLYFERANTSFETGTIAPAHVPAELARYAGWHWLRTAIGTAAFAAAVLGLRARVRSDG